LGFEETVMEFEKLEIDYEKIKNLSKEQREKNFSSISDLADTAIIHSSHGTSYRPMIKINIIISGREIISKVTIIDRSQLNYPMIIGRKNLAKFLIDVNK
jgi:hypothetical protein